MRKEFCIDTSGLSTPLEQMPYDLNGIIWHGVMDYIRSGRVAVTHEIFEEMKRIPDPIGECIWENEELLLLEVGNDEWDWRQYTLNSSALLTKYHDFISEYNGNSPKTVGINDISIITLGKTLGLPVVSMETSALRTNAKAKRRIPDICILESIPHYTFNEFLRAVRIHAS